MGGGDESAPYSSLTSAAAAPAELAATDRTTLEIKGAKLNVAIQNALRRKCSHDEPAARGPNGSGSNCEVLQGTSNNGNSCGADGTQHHQGANSSGSSGARDAGSAKEVALLKASVESLRAGLREKEDSATELEREKEGLLEQVAGLESATADNLKLGEKVADLKGQINGLEGKLRQAEAGQTMTTTLIGTLKSAQNDLRTAHGRVSQRYAELENTLEDSAEAIRRGNTLLHSQQLKIDAQSRQIKRHEEDLASLREERESYLRKADQNEAELAQAMRRERSGQGAIADAQAEVEDLKGELSRMQEVFARHRSVVRKNQDVIDAHEKALNDARSELLSLCLEAEKQSARHQKASADAASEISRATGEKNSAMRELRNLRIEKEELNDRLEETSRKLDESQAQQREQQKRLESAAKVAAAAAAASTAVNEGENYVNAAASQPHASSRFNGVSTSQFGTTNTKTTSLGRRSPAASQDPYGSLSTSASANKSSSSGIGGRHLWNNASPRQQRQRVSSPSVSTATDVGHEDNSCSLRQDYRASFKPQDRLTEPTREARKASNRSPSFSLLIRPSNDGTERRVDVRSPEEDASMPSDNVSDNAVSYPPLRSLSPSPVAAALAGEDHPARATTSAADAGGGGGIGGIDGNGRGKRGGGGEAGRRGDHSDVGKGDVGEDDCETVMVRTRKNRPSFAAVPGYGGQKEDVLMSIDKAAKDDGGASSRGGDGPEQIERNSDRSAFDHGDGSNTARGESSGRRSRSRPRSPCEKAAPREYDPDDKSTTDLEGMPAAAEASPPESGVGSSRKRARMAPASGHDAGAADANAFRGAVGFSSPPSLVIPGAPHVRQHHFVLGSRGSGKADVDSRGIDGAPGNDETAPVDDEEDIGNCPACGDSPYGLMINCSSCSRQHHSSCVPEGHRVGKGLGSVFRCSKCIDKANEG